MLPRLRSGEAEESIAATNVMAKAQPSKKLKGLAGNAEAGLFVKRLASISIIVAVMGVLSFIEMKNPKGCPRVSNAETRARASIAGGLVMVGREQQINLAWLITLNASFVAMAFMQALAIGRKAGGNTAL